jgi:hypothetical protein
MKYDKDKTPIEVEQWIAENGYQQPNGATARMLYNALGIAEDTWYDWRKKSEITEAIKEGQEQFRINLCREVEKSLAYLAKPHTIEAGKRKIYKLDKNGQPQLAQMVVDEKHVEPNIEAIREILHNIDPEHWKQKQTTELITPNGASITFVSSDKTAEDLKKAAEMFRRATAEEASEEEETNGDRGNESV